MDFIQANLQRSKQATIELLKAAEDQGVSVALVQEPYVGSSGTLKQYPGTTVIQCTLRRSKPVKAAIIVFGDRLRIIHDPQLVTETEAAVILEAGSLRVGLVSLYLEGDQDIAPYIERTKAICNKLSTSNILIGGDINAWSHWWGSTEENSRGEAYNSFLNEMDLHVLNVGDTPTFEEFRRGKLCTSIVDVTACSSDLLAKIRDWKVDRSLTTSDHNAIKFALAVGETITPVVKPSTRKYNTKKAKWLDFDDSIRLGLQNRGIDQEKVNSVSDIDDLENLIVSYTETITDACDHTIPLMARKKGKPTPPWWTDALQQQKSEVLRKKRRIRNAAPHRIETVLADYREAKSVYQDMCSEAQTKSWKEFCTSQERESMWDGIYRVIRNTTGRQEDCLLRDETGNTLNPKRSADLLAQTFYPDDSVSTDNPHHTNLRKLVSGEEPTDTLPADDPPFTEAELETVLKNQNPKKAPGPDGLTADICVRAIQAGREVFMAIANKCLAMGHFPARWKSAHVVILKKPGKDDYTNPKSYRPIGLLSVLGKIVEKLVVNRLQWHLLPTLNANQYGFMPQRGTEDALYDLMRHINERLSNRKSVIVVSLDIEGAFDNAWWPALKNQLITRRCPKNLYKVVNSYLENRHITVHYAGESSTRRTTKGCVQGSIAGPTFWNLILDSLLHMLSGENVHYQAFADDCVLVFSGDTVEGMEENVNKVLADIVRWGQNNKLNFAAQKTHAMLLTKKLKYSAPSLNMSGIPLTFVDEIKLLGVTIDRHLNFANHIKAVCKKAANLYKQLACAAKVTWGLNGEIIRTIYIAVIEPIVLYGACAWAKAASLQVNRKRLERMQRNFAQKISKSYKTVSLTSALILSGTLPIDLRIQEVATLYEAKKGFSTDYIPPGRRLEGIVKHSDHPHPSAIITTEYELLENMDSETVRKLNITGPQIYTDGSKLEGKVGAALTWWENGKESLKETFALDPACTVFQSELYALHRAVLRAKESGRESVNILSDSRSSLELLANPKLTHPLAKTIKENIAKIRAAGKQVRLFWLRAHVGTEGNERADELAKAAATTTTAHPDYAEIPLSFVKRKIREETIQKWQDRYISSETGSITKTFLPDVKKSYVFVRESKLSPTLIQILTGHGGFGEYLHRFGLKDSPGCICDPNTSESVWHLIVDCPQFHQARHDLENLVHLEINQNNVSEILMTNSKYRKYLTTFLENITRTVAKRNKDPTPPTSHTTTHQSQTHQAQTHPHTITTHPPINIIQTGEKGQPGIRLRGVALFMDTNNEKVGFAFCNDRAKTNVYMSPGLSALLNGSTKKNTMRRRIYNELQKVKVENHLCRIVRKNNKTIALFCWDDTSTPFQQVCRVLQSLAARGLETERTSRKISVDAMVVGYMDAESRDHIGTLQASKHHEMVVYEDRGQDLSHLLPPPRDTGVAHLTLERPPVSGSERLQQRLEAENSQPEQKAGKRTKTSQVLQTLSGIFRATPISKASTERAKKVQKQQDLEKAVAKFVAKPPSPKTIPSQPRTKAEMGLVAPPKFTVVADLQGLMRNAFAEFVAVTVANRKVGADACSAILRAHNRKTQGLLRVLLAEAEAAIYDNSTQQVLCGTMTGPYMAAYSLSDGFVGLRESSEEPSEDSPPVFNTPSEDPIVVVARCTKIMLDDRILEMANAVKGKLSEGTTKEHRIVPRMSKVNGVPGCGKTTWIVSIFNTEEDMTVTTTTEAAKDLRARLEQSKGKSATTRVRTMASLLVNGMRKGDTCKRLLVDEALMNHFGSIVMAALITAAEEVLMIGDENQLPYIDRNNLFALEHNRPNVKLPTTHLLCTHRCPQDVPYALKEVHEGIYSSRPGVRSLTLQRYTGASIPKAEGILYLVHTQVEKNLLKSQGFGIDENSRVQTIHEAQGLTYEHVVIVRTENRKLKVAESVPHAVVAISRHTKTCVYYADNTENDAVARFIRIAERATAEKIQKYNIEMAMKSRDQVVLNQLTGDSSCAGPSTKP